MAVPGLLILCVAAVHLASNWITGDPDFYAREGWPPALALILTAMVTWLFARRFCRKGERTLTDEETGEQVLIRPKHSFMFVPVRSPIRTRCW